MNTQIHAFHLDFASLERAATCLGAWAAHCGARACIVYLQEPGENPVALLHAVDGDWPSLEAAASALAPFETSFRARRWSGDDSWLEPEVTAETSFGPTPACARFPFSTARGGRGELVLSEPSGVVGEPSFLDDLARQLPLVWSAQAEHERWVRGLLSALRPGVMVVDSENRIRLLDHAACEILGIEARVPDVVALERASGIALGERLDQARRSVASVRGEFHAGPRRPAGVGYEARPLEAPAGAILVSLQDLGERQRVERQQSEFIGVIGHELKTPVTSARTAIELMSIGEAGALSDDQSHLVLLALRNLDRLGGLLDQLLDTARAHRASLLVRRETFALAGLLDGVFVPALERASVSGRSLELRVEPGCAAYVDPVRFPEIVENLVANALKFTASGGRIRVHVRADMPSPEGSSREVAAALGSEFLGCEIEVVDDGIGMDARTQKQAFETFFQDGDPLSDRPSGAGLGLSIVRALVEAHSGHLVVESEPGEGTAIRVWIPASLESARIEGALRALRIAREAGSAEGRRLRLALCPVRSEEAPELEDSDRIEGREGLLCRLSEEWVVRLQDEGAPLPDLRGTLTATIDASCPSLGTLLARMLTSEDVTKVRPVPVP